MLLRLGANFLPLHIIHSVYNPTPRLPRLKSIPAWRCGIGKRKNRSLRLLGSRFGRPSRALTKQRDALPFFRRAWPCAGG